VCIHTTLCTRVYAGNYDYEQRPALIGDKPLPAGSFNTHGGRTNSPLPPTGMSSANVSVMAFPTCAKDALVCEWAMHISSCASVQPLIARLTQPRYPTK
jgi:hypothetical protein